LVDHWEILNGQGYDESVSFSIQINKCVKGTHNIAEDIECHEDEDINLLLGELYFSFYYLDE